MRRLGGGTIPNLNYSNDQPGGTRPGGKAGGVSFTAISWQYDESVRVDPQHPIRIDLVRAPTTVRYVVRRAGDCLSKTGEWEYEPLPSSRDEEFIARCRFETFGEAAMAVERFCPGGKGRLS